MRLPFEIEEQIGPCLCWAAVGSALAQYYRPMVALDQHQLVVECLGSFDGRPYCPVAAMTQAGVWRATLERPLRRQEIAAEIAARRPFVVQLALGVGGNHLVVVSGIEDDRLWVEDPRDGGSWIPYALLVSDTWTRWTRSLLTG